MHLNRALQHLISMCLMCVPLLCFGLESIGDNLKHAHTIDKMNQKEFISFLRKSAFTKPISRRGLLYVSKQKMTMSQITAMFSLPEENISQCFDNSVGASDKPVYHYFYIGPGFFKLRPCEQGTFQVEVSISERYRWADIHRSESCFSATRLIPMGFRKIDKGVYKKEIMIPEEELDSAFQEMKDEFMIKDGEYKKLLGSSRDVPVDIELLRHKGFDSVIKMKLNRGEGITTLITIIEDVIPKDHVLLSFSEEMEMLLKENGYENFTGGVYRKSTIKAIEASECFGFDLARMTPLRPFNTKSEQPIWYVWLDGACVVLREKRKEKDWGIKSVKEKNKLPIKSNSIVDVEFIMGVKKKTTND